MRSFILQTIILMILIVVIISCEETAVTTEPENINHPPDNLTVMQVISTGNYLVRCFVSDGSHTTIDSVLIEVLDNSIVLPESNLTYRVVPKYHKTDSH